ncbi:MAG: hypothetical protein AB1Z65_08940 [Candidatus Sulfomarinibacteraceae bacterium]
MKSFEVPGTSPSAFVEEMRSALAARQYDRYVSLDLDGDSLVVEFRWMGASRFDFRVVPAGEGFRAEFVGQRIAPLHNAFSDRFEVTFEKALARVGARAI